MEEKQTYQSKGHRTGEPKSVLGIPAYIAYRWMMPGFIAAVLITIAIIFNIDRISVDFSWSYGDLSFAILMLGGILAAGFFVSILSYYHTLLYRENQKCNYYKYICNDHDTCQYWWLIFISKERISKCIGKKACKCVLALLYIIDCIFLYIPIISIPAYMFFIKKEKDKIKYINKFLSSIYNDPSHPNASQDFHLAYGSMNIGYTVATISVIYLSIGAAPIVSLFVHIMLTIIIYLLATFYAWKMLGFGYDKLFQYNGIRNNSHHANCTADYTVLSNQNSVEINVRNRHCNESNTKTVIIKIHE